MTPENLRALGFELNLENWEAVYNGNERDAKVYCFNKIIKFDLDTCTALKRVRIHPNHKEWLTLQAKAVDFQVPYNDGKTRISIPRAFFVCFYNIIFCRTNWFTLKQLDNSPSLSKGAFTLADLGWIWT